VYPVFSADLSGQAAIVTGAGDGVGRAVALDLARCGAAVAVNDLNPDRTETIAEEIETRGGQALPFQGDVANRYQAAALIETAREHFGRISILVNAASIYKTEPLDKIDEWDWRRQLDVNLNATFFCTQLIGRVMCDEGGGSIVNIASDLWNRTPAHSAGYVTTKAAVVGFTRQAAREFAGCAVRVNAVCPGPLEDEDPGRPVDNMLGRPGTSGEVAAVVIFLCTEAASFITGQALHVDGGRID
jgi:3-oxoacyl-[acyl-carrier protein] reductase